MLHFGLLYNRPNGALQGGFIGVDIFFVLSGFLITSLLVRESARSGGLSFKNFYMRRALRLLPALFAFLVANLVFIAAIGENMKDAVRRTFYVIFYVSNFAQSHFDKAMLKSSFSLTWSLSIEEQFYLVWPAFLLFGILRFCKTRTQVLAVIGLGVIVSALIRIYIWHGGAGYPAAYMRPDARGDGLLIGAACAFLWRWRMVPLRYLSHAATVCALALLVTALFWPKTNEGMFYGGFTVVALATGVVVLAVVENRTALMPVLTWKPLVAIGKVSYGLYLYHALSLRVASRHIPVTDPVPLTIVGLAIAALLTFTSWWVIEQPFLRLKDRFASAT